MEIGSVSSAYGNTATQSLQRQPEASETRQFARKQEDEARRAEVAAAEKPKPQPTVNLNGQKVGQLINDFA